jgi:peptide/nickel transport system permease protein
MLTLIVFSLLLLQSSLNEVFNPRLRRGRAARKRAKDEGEELEVSVEGDDAGPVGSGGFLETPVSAGRGESR